MTDAVVVVETSTTLRPSLAYARDGRRGSSFIKVARRISQLLPFLPATSRAISSTSLQSSRSRRGPASTLLKQYEYPLDVNDSQITGIHRGLGALRRIFIGSSARGEDEVESAEDDDLGQADEVEDDGRHRSRFKRYGHHHARTISGSSGVSSSSRASARNDNLRDWIGSFEIGGDLRNEGGVGHSVDSNVLRTPTPLDLPIGDEDSLRMRKDSVLKQDRMLVRIEWTSRTDIPSSYDENTARKFEVDPSPWAEFDVKLKEDRLELWQIPTSSIFSSRKAKLRHRIALDSRSTSLSLYSSTDLTFCITTASDTVDAIDGTRAKRRKRDQVRRRGEGTKIIILRPCRISLSKEWIWRLFFRLGGRLPSVLDITVPALGAQIQLPLPPLLSQEDRHTFSAANIVAACSIQLSCISEWSHLLEQTRTAHSLRLAWRRNQVLDWVETDLDWIVGYAIRQPHLDCRLELRLASHYPTTARYPSIAHHPAQHLSEPPSVEGYLERIKGNGAIDRIYLSSHDGHLFLSSAKSAYPPLPPSSNLVHSDDVTITRDVDGSPRESKEGGSSDSADESPLMRLERAEQDRAFRQIRFAKSHLDFCDIESVSLLDKTIEIVLKWDQLTRFRCSSNAVALEWTKRIEALVKYWKRRDRLDLQHRIDLSRLAPTSKFDLDATFSPLLGLGYNRCVVERCRTILHSGSLYTKLGLRGTFLQNHFILLRGHLIEYESYTRSFRGQITPSVYFRRINTLHLKDSYLFSGQLCRPYLRSQHSSMDASSSRRIYSDSYESSDELEDCIFVLWRRGKRPRVFRARSTIERNEWIFAIGAAVE